MEADYINSLIDQINAVDTCQELDVLAQKAADDIKAHFAGTSSQLAFLKPVAELLENPAADLAKIVQWIGQFIDTVLKPLYAPVVALEQEMQDDIAAVARLTAAVTSAAERIGSCAVEFPANVIDDTTS